MKENLPFSVLLFFQSFLFIIFVLVNSDQSNENDDYQQCVTYLSDFVYLPNVNEINFVTYVDIYGWKDIQFILQ
jgi:hypothetical protein